MVHLTENSQLVIWNQESKSRLLSLFENQIKRHKLHWLYCICCCDCLISVYRTQSWCNCTWYYISIIPRGNQKWILIVGTVLFQSCPLLFTTMSNDLLSANQCGRPRQLPTSSRQYGPTRTWETLWTRLVGTRATLRYLLPLHGHKYESGCIMN